MKKSTFTVATKVAMKQLRESLCWTTASGDEIPIGDLESSHIQNIIIMLAQKQELATKYKVGKLIVNDMTADEWIEILKEELNSRS